MDELGSIIIAICAILSAVFKVRKKRADTQGRKKEAPAASPVQPPAPAAAGAPPMPAQPIPAAQPLSAFQPAPAQIGAEGEDTCHDYILSALESVEERAPVSEESNHEELAQELLKGVVFSEILQRPKMRPCGRRRA